MILHPQACEWYRLTITTDPATDPLAWELSPDGGSTWYASTGIDGVPSWLVAGEEYDGDSSPTFVVTGVTYPLLRLVDDPETLVDQAPPITVESADAAYSPCEMGG